MTHHDHPTDVPHTGSMRHGIVSALFHDADEADAAFRRALDAGVPGERISILLSDQARDEYFPSEVVEVHKERKTLEGTGVGSAIGMTVGAIAGAIAAVGTTVALPGLGLIVAGPLAAAIAGAGAGGVTGGLVGALVGTGLSEERAELYRTSIEEGGIVLVARPQTEKQADAVEDAWKDEGGAEVYRSDV